MGDKSSFMDILYSTAAASAILRSQDEPKDQYPILLSFYHSVCVLRDQDHAIASRLMPGLRDILAACLSRWYLCHTCHLTASSSL